MIRRIFLGFGLLIIVTILALAGIFSIFIRSEQFKTQVTEQIHRQTGLQVILHGKTNWTMVPRLGLSFNDVEVIHPLSFDPHSVAKAQQAEIFIAWQPLRFGQIQIQKLIFNRFSLSFRQSFSKNVASIVAGGDVQIDAPSQQLVVDNLTVDSGALHATGKISGQGILQTAEFAGQLKITQLSGLTGALHNLTNAVIDFHLMPNQAISGKFNCELLTINRFTLSNLSAKFNVQTTNILINEIKGTLAGGLLTGQMNIEHINALPHYAINMELAHGELSKLLESGILQGPADITAQLTMEGNTQPAILASLNGATKLTAYNGVLNHIDLLKQIRSVRQFLQVNSQTGSAGNLTHFTQLTASGTIKNGLFTNRDFVLQSPDLQATGAGTINMIDQEIKYAVSVRVQGKMLGNAYDVSAPLTITGTLSHPHVKFDFSSMSISTQPNSDQMKKLGKDVHNELKILFGH